MEICPKNLPPKKHLKNSDKKYFKKSINKKLSKKLSKKLPIKTVNKSAKKSVKTSFKKSVKKICQKSVKKIVQKIKVFLRLSFSISQIIQKRIIYPWLRSTASKVWPYFHKLFCLYCVFTLRLIIAFKLFCLFYDASCT